MNNKMAISTYLLTIQPRKQTKQTRTENHGYGEHFDGCKMGRGVGGMGEEVRGLSTNRWIQNSPGDVKYSVGNGAAKEPI